MLSGQDLMGKAQTGTGKTAAFGIPSIDRVNPAIRFTQVLVVCPTRELAVQVTEHYKKLLKFLPQVGVMAVYGGEPITKQFKLLRRNPQIVVGTPGRLLDHLKRGTLDLSTVHTVVLDEADEMLNMGFREPIEALLQTVPQPRQLAFFSATLPPAMKKLMSTYLNNPATVEAPVEPGVSLLIDQYYLDVIPREKMNALTHLMDTHPSQACLLFCNTQRGVDNMVTRLTAQGHSVEGLHGGLPQNKRDRVMSRFRKGAIKVLVATDVAARGIDVSQVDTVINYDFPHDVAFYTHRIGRTGRAGKSGVAYTLVEPTQRGLLGQLRRQPELSINKYVQHTGR